ncbi:hypothetical protein NQX30_01525 [Candidatus Persebacteraceae bacterium Df01]|uniref:Secreted protein n=1 Tax=Candidatus Doriopsillibacter californiensis TaxID=2970740 RepID=A0ABT7QK70_9GAMM|nr:hypothetical protein [Candidatus Persebacteraceae bacterium Df01]
MIKNWVAILVALLSAFQAESAYGVRRRPSLNRRSATTEPSLQDFFPACCSCTAGY